MMTSKCISLLGRRFPLYLTGSVSYQKFPPVVNYSSICKNQGLSRFKFPPSYTVRGVSRKSFTCDNCSHSYQNGGNGNFVELVSCPKCKALQKIDSLPDYFQILGQEVSYSLDLNEIANKTKQLQKRFHPDLYGSKGEDQQSLSQDYSSLVNKALSTLTDPIARGRYLLSLKGISVEDTGVDNIESTMTKDPEFLEEIMELNERLEDISSEKEWKEFRESNSQTILKIHRDLEESFNSGDLKEAQMLLGRMQYFQTLQSKLKELQSRIGVVE